jgi:TPR repeat protein
LSLQTDESFEEALNRRTGPRTKLVEIAYIGMGPENGGLVLDVSDGGLSFQAVAPVQRAEKIKFILSLRGHSRIEGAGEVVWTNQMGTVCGMKFTSLSTGALEYLNNWTNQSSEAPAARAVVPDREKAAEPAPNADAAASTDVNQTTFSAAPVFAFAPAAEEPLSESDAPSRWQSPLFFWSTFGVIAATLPFAAFLFGVHIGKSEYKSGAQPAPDHVSQTNAPIVSGPTIPALTHAAGAQAAPKSTPSVPSAEAPVANRQIVNAAKAAGTPGVAKQALGDGGGRRAGKTSDDGKSDLAAALAQLNGDNGRRDTSSAVRLLWVAVSKGNSAAAVILADLYVYGDGVEKNCEQANTLLTSASKKGNTEAKVKLDELNAEGCP